MRRKQIRDPSKPKCLNHVEKVQSEVEQLRGSIIRAGMELEDVFADVDTPDCSSDEDAPEILVEEDQPMPPHLHIPHQHKHLATLAHFNVTVQEMIDMLLKAKCQPSRRVKYSELYTMYNYRKKSEKKLKVMKSFVTEENVKKAIADNSFWRQVLRVDHTYQRDGGRRYLHLLVAFFCYLEKEKNNEDSSDAEYLDSEISDDSDTDDSDTSESDTDSKERNALDDHGNAQEAILSANL